MSLLNPAPINNQEISSDLQKFIKTEQPKKNNLKKTIKKRREIKNIKVNDFLDSLIDSDSDSDSDNENNNLGNFKDNNMAMPNMTLPNMTLPNPKLYSKKPQPVNNFNTQQNTIENNNMLDSAVTQEQFKSMDANYTDKYVSQFVPYTTNVSNTQEIHGSKDVLFEKLNYMINLLEEQQEEKTGHVTEELILYCFLGVFMIFVVDSFARVGKYVR
jgi:hypothetical protein